PFFFFFVLQAQLIPRKMNIKVEADGQTRSAQMECQKYKWCNRNANKICPASDSDELDRFHQ
ncbi:MAG: hypothetical protein KDA60_22935, partial [Planctomycetales bacterium]|nr:hypothetical protein [Planctomycetales bacterium]